MDSKQRISLARWHAEMAALYQRQNEGHRNLMQLPEAAQHQMMAHNHLNTAEVLILLADALDGLTAEDVAAMQTREDAGCAAMSEDGNYDELCRQDKARLLAVVEKLMEVRNAGS